MAVVNHSPMVMYSSVGNKKSIRLSKKNRDECASQEMYTLPGHNITEPDGGQAHIGKVDGVEVGKIMLPQR